MVSVIEQTAPRGSASPRSIAAMLLLAIIWGLSIPVTKLGLLTLPPLTLTALRFLIATPLLLMFAMGDTLTCTRRK